MATPLNTKHKFVLTCIIALLLSVSLAAQQSAAYRDIIEKIQAQEVNFPFPQLDTTILVGEINANADKPVIHFLIPYNNIRHQYIPGTPEPDLHTHRPNEPSGDFIVGAENITDTDRAIVAGNHFHLSLRFKILSWASASPTITFSVGSKTVILQKGGNREFTIDDVLDTDPVVSCYYPVTQTVMINPAGMHYYYNNVLHIKWDVAGAGIVNLPVLPIKVIYVPVQDAKKSNSASISNTTSLAYATSMSITTTNSTTTPIPTSLSDFDDFLGYLNDIGQAMEKSGDPDEMAAGKAISTISDVIKGGLGSQAITKTITNAETNQSTVATGASETDTKVAKSGVGGPGDGDVIAFYTNAQLVWVAYKGRLRLMLLGFNPELKSPSAWELKQALVSLNGKPAGTKDAKWGLDAKAISSLLALDPFSGPRGAFTQLDPTRYTITKKLLDGSDAYYQIGGDNQTISVTHTVTSTDTHSTATTVTNLEVDKPGFLSFLGGPAEEKTAQLVYSKSSSSQYSIGQTITGAFTLNGDGQTDYYHCEVLFDNVFGTFAFRDHSLDLDDKNAVSGVVYNPQNKVLPNTRVYLKAGKQTYTSTSNEKGQFQFQLPYKFAPGELVLYKASDSSRLNFTGQAISNLKFTVGGRK